MRPRNVVILAIVLIAALAWMIPHYRETQRRKLREAGYQATLTSYSSELKLGMTRQEVHDLFQRRNIVLFREPYGGPPLDDFIKVGREQDKWYCSWENVDIQLQFTASKPDSAEPTPHDFFRDITLSRWPYDCM
jgi:hypothetical protein